MKFTGEMGSCASPFSALVSQSVTSSIRLLVRQRPQHYRIDDGEDSRRGSGAEAEHQHGHQRKGRMLA